MILCQCMGVTDRAICELIQEGAVSVAEITRRCGAGRCCAPCREGIAALLYRTRDSSHTGGPQVSAEHADSRSP